MNDSAQTPEPTKSGCVACTRSHTAEDFVCCDKCDSWWHFSCAGVTASVEGRDWICARCLPVRCLQTSNIASSGRSISSSQRIRREQLLAEQQELERLQMQREHELQKKHLEQKHLLQVALEEEENKSVRSRRSVVSSTKRTEQWVEEHVNVNVPLGEYEGAVGGVVNNPTAQQDAQSSQQQGNVDKELGDRLKRCEMTSQQQIHALQDQLKKLQLELDNQKKRNEQTTTATDKGAIPKTQSNIPSTATKCIFTLHGLNCEISPVETQIPPLFAIPIQEQTGSTLPVTTGKQSTPRDTTFSSQLRNQVPTGPQNQTVPPASTMKQTPPFVLSSSQQQQQSVGQNNVNNRPSASQLLPPADRLVKNSLKSLNSTRVGGIAMGYLHPPNSQTVSHRTES